MQHYLTDKFYLFEVIVDNGFKGIKFVLHREDVKQIGLDVKDIKKYLSGKKFYSGFLVSQIPRSNIKEYPLGIPSDVKKLLTADKRYFQTNIKPLVGEVKIGPYKGFKFSLFGRAEIEKLFPPKKIRRNFIERCCYFSTTSHKEAIKYHQPISKEVKESLTLYANFRINSFAVIGTVIKGKHKGLEFGLIGHTQIEKYFNNGNIHSAVNGRIKQAYNCTFKRVTVEEALPKIDVLNDQIVEEIKKRN